jgi:uncharacterized protein (TIGR00255 family)
MTRSMTAFARTETSGDWGRLVWEIRSVNHRYLETGLRLPDELRGLEGEVRTRIAARVGRGKVDCVLRFEKADTAASEVAVNEALATRLIRAAEQLAGMMASPAAMSPLEILRWPGVMAQREVDPEALAQAALHGLAGALDELTANRKREGAALRELVLQRCAAMRDVTAKLRVQVPLIIEAIRSRHAQRLLDLAASLDPARIEQETALLLQRLDVAEELDRLETHLTEVCRVLDQQEPVGRRLDFLMQELNREANTLGSKSAHVDTTGASIEMKVLIEQIREQIQNIE